MRLFLSFLAAALAASETTNTSKVKVTSFCSSL